MYKVVVIDDEQDVRQHISSMVNKANVNFEVISEYENGIDAIDGIFADLPDLVITDIKIPYIDGIELARRIKNAQPLIKIIIITGFTEYDYAKQAANLGVIGFLNKPILIDELKQLLDKAQDGLTKDFLTESNLTILKELHEKNVNRIIETDLYRLSKMTEISPNFEKKLAFNGVNLDYEYFLMVTIDFDQYDDQTESETGDIIFSMIKKYIAEKQGQLCDSVEFFGRFEKLCVLLKSSSQFDINTIESYLNVLILRLEQYQKVCVSMGVSTVMHGKKNFKQIYDEAMRAIECRNVMGGKKVFLYSNMVNYSKDTFNIDDLPMKDLGYAIKFRSQKEAIALLTKIKQKYLEGGISNTSYYYYLITGILNSIARACEDKDNYVFSQYNEIYKYLIELKNINEVFDCYVKLINEVRKRNQDNMLSGINNQMNKILEYIDSHYQDESLTLESLADNTCLSISYISTLFKKNKNTTFVKYLTNIRMEKAKQLLNNQNLKILEVAEMLGYSDPYYFSHCFKKQFGISPKEYRTNEN